MPVKISELPASAVPPTTADLLPIVQSSVTKRTTLGALFTSLLAFLQAGSSAVSRTAQSKMRDIVNVADFGATGDGVTDDTAAIIAALTYITSRGRGGKLYFGSGTFIISATLPLNESGLYLIGEGADEGRVSLANFPTMIRWAGGTNDNMLEIDTTITGTVDGGKIEGIILDAQDTSGVRPLYANVSASHWRLNNVCFRNYGSSVYLATSCFGWIFDDVEVFDSQGIGIELEGLNHHTTFNSFRGSGTQITAATSLIRVGTSDRCSNINFNSCDFEAENTPYQVELMEARAVNVNGGYAEVASAGITAIFRLGVTGTTACNGFAMNGFYVQGNDPTYTGAYALKVLNASGVDIGGGNHFRNLTTAVVDSDAACPNSNFGAGNYLENCGGTGNEVKFDTIVSGWSFHDSGTTVPIVVGTGGTANTYSTQTCQWWVRDGICYFDLAIVLTALNATGALYVDTLIPYNAAGSYDYPVCLSDYAGLTLAAGSMLMARVARDTNNIELREQVIIGTGYSSVLATEAGATLEMKIAGEFAISPAP